MSDSKPSERERFEGALKKLLAAKLSPAPAKEPVKKHRAQKRNTKKG